MDDYISTYLEIGGDRSKDTQLFLCKGIKEIPDGVVGAFRNGRVKIVDDNFIFHIDGFVGTEHQTSGRVNDPQVS